MIYIIIGIVVVLIILYQIGKSKQKSETNTSVSFNVQTNSSAKSEDDSKWEIVHRKTERWTELGFGDGVNSQDMVDCMTENLKYGIAKLVPKK